MPYITSINKTSDWLQMGQTFVTNAAAEASVLSLSASQVSGLTATFDAFKNAVTELEAQKAALDAAVSTKEKNMDAFEALVRRYAKQFRGNPSVPDSVLELLNVAPHSTPSSLSSPTQPQALVATTNSVGQVFLKFKRAGNISGTTFWIQAKTADSADWATVETTTTSKITLENYAAGQPAWFRVIAVRRGLKSAPSNPVTIYSDGEEGSLTLAA